MPTDTAPRRRRRAASNPDGAPRVDDTPPAGMEPPPQTPPGASVSALEKKLAQFIGSFSLPFAMAGDNFCASVIAQGAEPLAKSWANLAKESPAVKRVLEKILEGGAWGGVVISTLGIALPMAQHHGMLPEGFPNPFLSGPMAEALAAEAAMRAEAHTHVHTRPPAPDPSVSVSTDNGSVSEDTVPGGVVNNVQPVTTPSQAAI